MSYFITLGIVITWDNSETPGCQSWREGGDTVETYPSFFERLRAKFANTTTVFVALLLMCPRIKWNWHYCKNHLKIVSLTKWRDKDGNHLWAR